MKKNKLNLWRNVLIGLLLVAIPAIICLLVNVDNIIDYKLEPVADNIDSYVDEHFGYDALSEEEKDAFRKRNSEKLEEYRNIGEREEAREVLYMNQLYRKVYGEKAFKESTSTNYYDDGEEAYRKRVVRLKKRAYIRLYPQWEKEYQKYTELSAKESNERMDLNDKLHHAILICGLLVCLLSYRKTENKNRQAKYLAIYNVVCEVLCLAIAFVIPMIQYNLKRYYDDYHYTLVTCCIFLFICLVVNSIMISYLSKKSKVNESYTLIPNWLKKPNYINSELSKRLFLILVSYPLFYLVPIPYAGIYVFVLYIIPMALVFAIVNLVIWIFRGRKIDKTLRPKQKAMIYCRFCGKLIDADSDYCCHCGKKL